MDMDGDMLTYDGTDGDDANVAVLVALILRSCFTPAAAAKSVTNQYQYYTHPCCMDDRPQSH